MSHVDGHGDGFSLAFHVFLCSGGLFLGGVIAAAPLRCPDGEGTWDQGVRCAQLPPGGWQEAWGWGCVVEGPPLPAPRPGGLSPALARAVALLTLGILRNLPSCGPLPSLIKYIYIFPHSNCRIMFALEGNAVWKSLFFKPTFKGQHLHERIGWGGRERERGSECVNVCVSGPRRTMDGQANARTLCLAPLSFLSRGRCGRSSGSALC